MQQQPELTLQQRVLVLPLLHHVHISVGCVRRQFCPVLQSHTGDMGDQLGGVAAGWAVKQQTLLPCKRPVPRKDRFPFP